jgi:integrase
MGKLYKRGDVWWYQHRGTRTSTQCRDKQAAEHESKQIERRLADPGYRATERRLDDALDRYVQKQKEAGRAAGTLRMYGYHVKNLLKYLGTNVRLADLAPPNGARAVDQYLVKRTKDKAERTTQSKELSTLRGALRIAARLGEFPWAIETVMPYNFSQEYVPGKRNLTLEQVFELVAVLPRHRAKVVAFLVTFGADWQSVALAHAEDLTEDTCLIRGAKNPKRWRTLPILEPFAVLAILAQPPFVAWPNVRRDLAVACKRAGLPYVSPRDLRRSHGMILRARGLEPHLIAGMLGHADSRMVEKVYGRLTPDALGDLARARLAGT